MNSLTEPEFVRDAQRDSAASRDVRFAEFAPPSPRCAEILHVLNRMLDDESAALIENA